MPVWSTFLRRPQSGRVFGLSLTILPAPGAGWWLPGNPFPLHVGSWGDSVRVQGLPPPYRATAALKPKRAASAPCRDSWSLPLDMEGCSDLEDQSTKWKAYCALLALRWGRETRELVFMLSELWEQVSGRWVKVWGEITLLGLLCCSWEGQTAFPSLGAAPDCPEPPHCSASVLRGAGFWGGDGFQHLPNRGIHGFNFVGIHPSLNASYLGHNCCTLFGYRFAMKHYILSVFPKQYRREKEDDPFTFP